MIMVFSTFFPYDYMISDYMQLSFGLLAYYFIK